jgi:hypothetical protein
MWLSRYGVDGHNVLELLADFQVGAPARSSSVAPCLELGRELTSRYGVDGRPFEKRTWTFATIALSAARQP